MLKLYNMKGNSVFQCVRVHFLFSLVLIKKMFLVERGGNNNFHLAIIKSKLTPFSLISLSYFDRPSD